MSQPILQVSGLRVHIAGDEGLARILDHADFRLEHGKILGVVGESGCGKSTLIRTILGILPGGANVAAGTVLFEGEDILRLPEEEMEIRIRGSRIGFIPQDPFLSLNPLFKVGTQILEIMRWHDGASEDTKPRSSASRRAHVLRLLRRVQMPDPENALDRYPHQFSGGQRQRLLIAAALACAPALVIADEPTTALDVTTQQQIILLLRELVEEFSLSMLFVTHDLGVVSQLCDEICVIYSGQTVEQGPTRAVLDSPRHPYTRALIACHPERSNSFVGIPGMVPSPLRAPPGCRFAPRCSHATRACSERTPRLVEVATGHRADCVLYDQPATAESLHG